MDCINDLVRSQIELRDAKEELKMYLLKDAEVQRLKSVVSAHKADVKMHSEQLMDSIILQ